MSIRPLRRCSRTVVALVAGALLLACAPEADPPGAEPGPRSASAPSAAIEPDHILTSERENIHDKFSSAIPPVLTVRSGAVVEAHTLEATGGQLSIDSTVEDLDAVDLDRIHALTGPVFVEGADPGDILAVTLLELEPGDWGWTGVWPDFGFLEGDIARTDLKTYAIDKASNTVEFAPGIRIPLRPFAGVMGVAPATEEMLSTIPPRANGGNLDDPHLVAGTTVYFPVFVEGALFSIGDTHAVQGLGEVGGSAVEAPMRIVYRVEVLEGRRPIPEPQYETDAYYATTGFAPTIDEAARKATRYMLDHIEATYGMSRSDATMLCSLACDLMIAEVVDVPNMLVAMHLRKDIFVGDVDPHRK
jgi:acetamidase/formamidase